MNLDDSIASGSNGAPQVKPLLRTVLLCDIVESTALVERLGDMRAALLLQKHDQLLRQTITFCHGQLIDKADGVLALFERPIQALDFALRYQRGLRDLAQAEGMPLKARIGLHVGDVMMWANEPRDVKNGAKPFEVEGLAKPVAARLMNLALPGQILMSGMAQNLCQRAVGELGEAGKKLRFLLHGRYRFKGVPAPMLVHEVGEPGLSPLRAPESGAKAWRELPLWRRPPVLALEVLLVTVLAVGGLWTTFRAPPAIAFAERDWVVVADLQNRTSEPLFDDALDTALRVGLEQSRHINLISELQIDRALERMQRVDQPVDRQLATELALREGARAVILPTVAEVGGLTRISLEVIDPNTGVTVYSESADSQDANGVLPALDVALARVRGELGEALGSIENSARPLDRVTTADLEALRAFSLGIEARQEGRSAEALRLFEQAVRRDPDFSMAWLRMAAIELGNDLDKARAHFETAAAKRDRLTDREALLLDASLALFANTEQMLERWQLLASMYPDEYRAYYNYSYFAHFGAQRYRDAADFIPPALVPQNPARASAHYLLAANLLAADDIDGALKNFGLAASLGLQDARREHADAFAAMRNYGEAQRILDLQTAPGLSGAALHHRLAEVTHPLDQGRWDDAVAALAALAPAIADGPEDVRQQHRLMQLSLRSYAPDGEFGSDLRAFLDEQPARLRSAHALNRPQRQFAALAAAWLAARTGDRSAAQQMLAAIDPEEAAGVVYVTDMRLLVDAELALDAGDARAAVQRLQPRAETGDELYFLHSVLMRAHAAAGDTKAALVQAEWLATHRGRAFGEPNSNGAWSPVNIVESNLALAAAARFAGETGDDAVAARRRDEFRRVWPGGDRLEAVVRRNQAFD